jgi:hypothetical protein
VAVALRHAAEDERYGLAGKMQRGANNDRWLGSGDPPRTCSFCGGIHPEDAIRLVSENWRIEPTTKDYKRYLQPPLPGWHPTPPVKLYVQHFSDEQVERFNAATKKTRARRDFVDKLALLVNSSAIPGWLETPNDAFGGRRPQELLDSGEYEPLYEMLRLMSSEEPS